MKNSTIKNSSTYILIFSLSLVFINIISNGHIHQCADGRILYHSHPYEKSDAENPLSSHHHSEIEFYFHEFIARFFELAIPILFIFNIIFLSKFEYIELHTIYITNPANLNLSIRGPPDYRFTISR